MALNISWNGNETYHEASLSGETLVFKRHHL